MICISDNCGVYHFMKDANFLFLRLKSILLILISFIMNRQKLSVVTCLVNV